ncbi:MAG TPA: hypothetical protein VMK65_08105 [Longimicrobiales bacterium]|nr:hypothetical protein [Longimicrobiales bacterium]
MRGVPLGALALVLTWLLRGSGPSAAASAALLAPLLLLLALLLATLRAAGPWALADLALPGVLFGVAGGMLLGTSHRLLGVAYLVVAGIGIAALLVGFVVAHAEDRRARARDALVEAGREVRRVHRRLWLGTREVADADIRTAMEELARRQDGDPLTRAAVLLGAAAPICHARPQLAGELLAPPLALLRAGGVTGAPAVLRWVDAELERGDRLETDERGVRWLREALPGMIADPEVESTRPGARPIP